jgi:excisionase family DNA binding protein
LLQSRPEPSIRPVTPAHLSDRPLSKSICTGHNQTDRPEGIEMASMGIHELGPMLTASEVANLLHLHVNTVKRLGDRGELPFFRVCKRGDRRFRVDDVMQFLAKNR